MQIIKILTKKSITYPSGKTGTLIQYLNENAKFDTFAIYTIWIPRRFRKFEDIVEGKTYEMSIHNSYAVKLKPITE